MGWPLWAGIVGLSIGKKLTVLLLAKLYGFPKLYRKSLKGVRLVTANQQTRKTANSYIRSVFRLPESIAAKFKRHPAQPHHTKTPFSSLATFPPPPVTATTTSPSSTIHKARLAFRTASQRASRHSSRALQQLKTLKANLSPSPSYSLGASPLTLGARQKLQGARDYWREQVARQRGALYLQYATAATSAAGPGLATHAPSLDAIPRLAVAGQALDGAAVAVCSRAANRWQAGAQGFGYMQAYAVAARRVHAAAAAGQ